MILDENKIIGALSEAMKNPKIVPLLKKIYEYDKGTYQHSIDVAIKSAVITLNCKERGVLTDEEVNNILTGALLHDFGKTLIPIEITLKPGKLTNEEYKKMKDHTLFGYKYCKDCGIPTDAARVILEHHERINRSGYPFGLPANEICIGAKIVAIADSLDAIMQKRSYKSSRSYDEAMSVIAEGKGVIYDDDTMSLLYYINNIYNLDEKEQKIYECT